MPRSMYLYFWSYDERESMQVYGASSGFLEKTEKSDVLPVPNDKTLRNDELMNVFSTRFLYISEEKSIPLQFLSELRTDDCVSKHISPSAEVITSLTINDLLVRISNHFSPFYLSTQYINVHYGKIGSQHISFSRMNGTIDMKMCSESGVSFPGI